MPCSPNDVHIDIPSGPNGPIIPGFGMAFSLDLGDINPFPDGFPEDLLDILDKLQLLIPSGSFLPQLNANFGKDIFDGIMKILDQFLPFLMLYKFFLPILQLLICIIEVLCSLKNPFKVIKAIKRLFRKCIPAFLNLFPIFALIMMIISLLLLLLALIEYIIRKILALIEQILRNLEILYNAINYADSTSIIAAAKKLGSLLCIFQNLFVLLSIIGIIFQIFRDILSIAFAIPPCKKSSDNNDDGCCTTDVCPEIVQSNFTRLTGKMRYLSKVKTIPPFSVSTPLTEEMIRQFSADIRQESWQLYDEEQEQSKRFRNIFDAYDVSISPKPVFYPTDTFYDKSTPISQVAYLVDLRMYYNPTFFGRAGLSRWIRFDNCIVQTVPTDTLKDFNNINDLFYNGVLRLAGGLGTEDDGYILYGYDIDGVTLTETQATLENFLHKADKYSFDGILTDDGYTFTDVEYTFKPVIEVLWSKELISTGCIPEINDEKTFVEEAIAGDINGNLDDIKRVMDSNNGFPDPEATRNQLESFISTLRGDLTPQGVENFRNSSLAALNKLRSDTENSLSSLIGLGVDPSKSTITLVPNIQFTTSSIEVKIALNDKNGVSITKNIPFTVSESISRDLAIYIDNNIISSSDIIYDGYELFITHLRSPISAEGKITASYKGQMLSSIISPDNLDELPIKTIQEVAFKFVHVFSPGDVSGAISGQQIGKERRDLGDLSRE